MRVSLNAEQLATITLLLDTFTAYNTDEGELAGEFGGPEPEGIKEYDVTIEEVRG